MTHGKVNLKKVFNVGKINQVLGAFLELRKVSFRHVCLPFGTDETIRLSPDGFSYSQ
jgi:hypothetical protein